MRDLRKKINNNNNVVLEKLKSSLFPFRDILPILSVIQKTIPTANRPSTAGRVFQF